MIPVFQILSHKIGRYRVILGYDIIIFTNRYDPAYHLEAFGQIAKELRGYTSKCVISFVDIYTKNKKNMKALNAYFLTENDLRHVQKQLIYPRVESNIIVVLTKN